MLTRLEELWDVVDWFVIAESSISHHGDKKPLYFTENKELFAPYEKKIIHIVLDPPFRKVFSWEMEEWTRDAMCLQGLSQLQLRYNDLIILNDADEIPSRHVVGFLKYFNDYRTPISMVYRWSYYGFFWVNPIPTVMLSVMTLEDFNTIVQNSCNFLRKGSPAFSYLGGTSGFLWAGWHCSWCLPVEDWVIKLDSALSGDGIRWGDYPQFHFTEVLNKYKKEGKFFDGTRNGKLSTPDSFLFAPDFVLQHTDVFKYLMYRDVNSTLTSAEQVSLLVSNKTKL